MTHKKWKKDKSNLNLLNKFQNIRIRLEKSTKKAKKTYYKKKFENCIGDSRQIFNLLNELNGKTLINTTIPQLYSCVLSSDSNPSAFEVAEKFKKFFVDVGKNIKHSIPAEQIIYPKDIEMSIRLSSLSEKQIKGIIESLPEKTSSGEDEIKNIFGKAAGPVITRYLASIIYQSFKESCFPSELKKAKLIPLFKDGSRLDENNYRTISLLMVWSKTYERAIFTRIYEYMENFILLYSKQFRFRKKHSTIDALAELTEKIRTSKVETVNFFS